MEGVKEEVKAFAADTKGYSENAVETVKAEGKEVVEEIKAAVTGQKLESSGTEGGAGYRAESKGPSALEIAAIAFGGLSVLLRGILGVIAGLVGAVLGAKARSTNQINLATIGFILSAVGFVFSVLSILF